MFTGIIEALGKVRAIQKEGSNIHFHIETPFQTEVKVDQSIAHNGVCLTVTELLQGPSDQGTTYSVTAVQETLDKTQLGTWYEGTLVNLERCMKVGARLDGHFVQGHVDKTAKVVKVEELNGSWMYEFQHGEDLAHLLVNKGSICINGVSLTVVKAWEDRFSVTIIPFTHEHTNFHQLQIGDIVNLEYDILGKYIAKIMVGR